MIHAGQLKDRLTILNPVTTRNEDTGEPVKTNEDGDGVWGKIGPVQARWVSIAQTMDNQSDIQITLRYRTDLTPNHRLKWSSKVYHINSIIDDGNRHEALEILATEA